MKADAAHKRTPTGRHRQEDWALSVQAGSLRYASATFGFRLQISGLRFQVSAFRFQRISLSAFAPLCYLFLKKQPLPRGRERQRVDSTSAALLAGARSYIRTSFPLSPAKLHFA